MFRRHRSCTGRESYCPPLTTIRSSKPVQIYINKTHAHTVRIASGRSRGEPGRITDLGQRQFSSVDLLSGPVTRRPQNRGPRHRQDQSAARETPHRMCFPPGGGGGCWTGGGLAGDPLPPPHEAARTRQGINKARRIRIVPVCISILLETEHIELTPPGLESKGISANRPRGLETGLLRT